MDFKQLNKQIKQNDLQQVYVLTGSEDYLKDFYQKQLTGCLVEEHLRLLNCCELEGPKFSADALQEAADSYPFMAERKLVLFKSTGAFTRGFKNAALTDLLAGYIGDMPPYLYFLFVEDSVEKTSALFKKVGKNVSVVELDFLKGADLTAWITKQAALRKKRISNETISYLVEKCDRSLYAVMRELDKLAGYLDDCDTITKEHIDQIVTKSLESRIFDLVDCLIAGKKEAALQILRQLKQLREPEVKIASIINQHFIGLLFTKILMAERVSAAEIAKKLKKRDFVIRKYSQQIRGMDLSFLKRAVQNCSALDFSLKTSRYEDGFFALEQFVFAYGLE